MKKLLVLLVIVPEFAMPLLLPLKVSPDTAGVMEVSLIRIHTVDPTC